jgi:hypothetical protein
MHAARFAALFVTPPPPPSGEEESPPPSPALESPPSPVLPHQVVVMDAENVNRIHCGPFPAVVHPLGPPQQLYANQGDDDPDHPDCQTCNLAGSVATTGALLVVCAAGPVQLKRYRSLLSAHCP